MRRFAMGDVSVADMAAAREARAMRQQRLLMQRGALVCLTMNIPGPHKTSPLIAIAFEEGKRLIAQALPAASLAHELRDKTGFEAYYQAADDPLTVKRALCTVEDTTPLGRLFDIDVLTPAGDKVSREALGLPPRQCFLCGNPAFVCARSRAHSVQAMTAEIDRRILALYRERTIAHLSRAAVEALEQEARTTPKPGLVDARNCGSHPDMSLPLLLRSAHALAGYFAQCAALGFDCAEEELFPALQTAGMQAEADMLAATGGVNTHKGAVFSLGVLCAAAAQCAARFEDTPQAVCRAAGERIRPAVEAHFDGLTAAHSFGERLYLQAGIRGIRGEAAEGFPSIMAVWPDFVREATQLSQQEAGVRAVIRLLSRMQDTTLLKRGGQAGQAFAQAQARRIEAAGFPEAEIEALDEAMIARNLTCGGCADLLACLYFLYATASSEQWQENLP